MEGTTSAAVRWNSLERPKKQHQLSPHNNPGEDQHGQQKSGSFLSLRSGTPPSSSHGGLGQSPSGELHQHLQLLAVPQAHSPLEESSSSAEGTKFRRYSCNPPTKGLTSSPQPHLRRSSLAAIKWSVLARRISMGMAHERDPPEDPTKVTQ